VEVKVHREAGYEEALFGISLNKNQPIEKMGAVAERLAPMDGGHNKFLESMMIWVEVDAPRYFWQQADTYRIATKQSQSTMHTILKRKLTKDDFSTSIPWYTLLRLNRLIKKKDFDQLKAELPESFKQKRMWCISYKTLRNIYKQRKNHKLKEWSRFLDEILNQIEHPDFITK